MTINFLLEECTRMNLRATSIGALLRASTSAKVQCVAGIVDRILSDTAHDASIILRDDSNAVVCCVHSLVAVQYPMLLEEGTAAIFCDTTCCALKTRGSPTPSHTLLITLDNVVGVFMPSSHSELVGGVSPNSRVEERGLEFGDDFG